MVEKGRGWVIREVRRKRQIEPSYERERRREKDRKSPRVR